MIQLKTYLQATDKTAIVKVYCIKVLKNVKKKIAKLGDVIIICVNTINIKNFIKLKVITTSKPAITIHPKMETFIGVLYCSIIPKHILNSILSIGICFTKTGGLNGIKICLHKIKGNL